MTPGTPTFSGDAGDIVNRVAQGVGSILDISHRYQQLYGSPLPVNPSALIAEADRMGINPSELAERKFSFSKKEEEIKINRIRDEERAKIAKEYSERFGPNPDVQQPRGASKFADIRRAVQEGKRADPTRLSPEQRHQQALNAIHRAVEERSEREGN